ncbi:MAG: rubrerythrin [Planctomycetaceae bacterium]|nr:rubrerythrin [Planctomycetaceae bacterium]MCH2594509.1 ferritin-like domain-containing protein [Pirellulales bacterium]|tara:strand:+ start:117 stop:572 length:456 start_codon:yes stop_codon:yes gene_type:complete
MSAPKEKVIELLATAYSMEIETVLNYLANSVNLDGVRAEEIKKSLAADITEEIMHAQQLGQRIKQLGGLVPGSAAVKLGGQIQPTENTTDVVAVIKAVIDAEKQACAHYKEVIRATDGEDYVTQDLCIRLLADEEEHLVLFRGFLKEYELK